MCYVLKCLPFPYDAGNRSYDFIRIKYLVGLLTEVFDSRLKNKAKPTIMKYDDRFV